MSLNFQIVVRVKFSTSLYILEKLPWVQKKRNFFYRSLVLMKYREPAGTHVAGKGIGQGGKMNLDMAKFALGTTPRGLELREKVIVKKLHD